MDTARIADTDREQTAERLRVAVGEGRLDLAAYDERIQRVYGAVTRSELDGTVADLRVAAPAAHPVVDRDPAWRSWLAVSVLLLGIWAATSLASGHPLYFWPVWPIGGWGVALLRSGCGPRRRH